MTMTQDTKIEAVGHTAGPWKVTEGHSVGSVTVRQDCGEFQRPIAEIWHNGDDPATNAHLIAAAPDLLKALRKASNTLAGLGYASTADNICAAALAKAEGRAS